MTNKKEKLTTLVGMLEDEIWTIEYHNTKANDLQFADDTTYHNTMVRMHERFKEIIKDEIANLIG